MKNRINKNLGKINFNMNKTLASKILENYYGNPFSSPYKNFLSVGILSSLSRSQSTFT